MVTGCRKLMGRLLFYSACLSLSLTGCSLLRDQKTTGYETIAADVHADTKTASEKNREAIEKLQKGDREKAHKLVDEALIADVNHAPSHNTLGLIHFQKGNYYLAAWEFEFALKISPGAPEYHNNLGLVFEAADRLEDAANQYAVAVGMAPDNYQFVSNYARVRVRAGEVTPETRELLERVVMLDPRHAWKDWARQQLTQSHLDVPPAAAKHTVVPPEDSMVVPEVPTQPVQ
jgi:Tfp pilus assembly protein PilF